jgi:hypothetical protein
MKFNQILYAGLTALSVFGTATALTNRHNQLFEQLDVANQKVFQKGQKVRDDFFDAWSESQIREWLESHKINAPANYEQAKAVAAKNKDLLAADIRAWLEEAQKTASPLLSKSKEQLTNAKDAIFEQTAKTWSDSKLREFLEARGVFDYADATREQLLSAVNDYRHWTIDHNYLGSWSFDAFNSDDIKHWFEEQGKKVDGTRHNLVKSAQDYVSQIKSKGIDTFDATKDAWNREKKAAFKTWSDSDLRDYLNSFGKVDSVTDRKSLVEKAQQNYNFFVHGPQKSYTQQLSDHITGFYYKVYGYVDGYSSALYERIKGVLPNRGDL